MEYALSSAERTSEIGTLLASMRTDPRSPRMLTWAEAWVAPAPSATASDKTAPASLLLLIVWLRSVVVMVVTSALMIMMVVFVAG